MPRVQGGIYALDEVNTTTLDPPLVIQPREQHAEEPKYAECPIIVTPQQAHEVLVYFKDPHCQAPDPAIIVTRLVAE